MVNREFVVPTDQEMVDELGVTFDSDGPGEWGIVRSFDLTASNGDTIKISYDIQGRSFRYRWRQGNELASDSYREGAVRLNAQYLGKNVSISVDFDTDELRGSLHITVGDTIGIRDEMFFS